MMKQAIYSALLMAGLAMMQPVWSAPKFNHAGIQKGAISESCYHEPCSIGKVLVFKQLNKTRDSSMIELTLLGGERMWKSKKITWNKRTHKVYITCSLSNPTLTIGGQVTTLPLSPRWTAPGVLYSATQLYMQTCHNMKGADESEVAKRFGYNVEDNYY